MENVLEHGVFAPAGGVKTVRVFGIEVDFLLSSGDTNGAFSSYRVHVEPGDGAPPHTHRNDDESFYVLEGEFEVLCGEKVTVVGAGAFVFLPRGLPHYFRNVGPVRGQLLGVATPAGHELFFEDVAQLGPSPSQEEAIAVCLKHGIELAPPPRDV